MNEYIFPIGSIASILFTLGSVFKILHSPGANLLLTIGLTTYLIGFIFLLFIEKVTIESRRASIIALIFLLVTLSTMFFYTLLTVFPVFEKYSIGYLSIILTMFFFLFFPENWKEYSFISAKTDSWLRLCLLI